MRGNIRVFCRCRYDQRTECAVGFPSDRELQMPGNKKPFKFDKVFTPRSTQEEVGITQLATNIDPWLVKSIKFNPYTAEILSYKSWRPKGVFQFEIIINVLVISF